MDVSLPKLEKNIMYSEKVYAPPIQKQQKKVVAIRDPELHFDNPAETKHLMMLSAHRVIFDKDLKPTKDEKEKIDVSYIKFLRIRFSFWFFRKLLLTRR